VLLSGLLFGETPKKEGKLIRTVKDPDGIGVVLEIELEKSLFEPRENIDIKISITNNSSDDIGLPDAKRYYNLIYVTVTNKENGKEVPFTLFGNKAISSAVFDSGDKTLKPKERFNLIYELDRMFDLSLESEYSINFGMAYFRQGPHGIKLENVEFKIESVDSK
jgi:hypothetical protein